ncbi:hypothetical protein DDB_G0276097 [Dictyostelium discoideum AX4]|uniref:G domain-containing protein n=1 Tax=Dictyostelium discoideum TaxID=44689 RepID=Q75JI6_DICDI|nr:hypothetical protein DDB_G0276097 [Dictyostelium discoideum AX4]EAL69348.1 hypothetical protein DDB_G0276097 [Dictyostelium discoideum AX4]|eukprot:XP_643276.1 hypothetical protein DDB_G0276097 [Dictyostelium discoideum AX4]
MSSNTQTVPINQTQFSHPPPPPSNFGWIFALFGAIIGIPSSIRNLAIKLILTLIFVPLLTIIAILNPSLQLYLTERKISICYYWSSPWFCTSPKQLLPMNYSVIIDIKSILSLKDGWEIVSDGGQFSKKFLNQDAEYQKILIAITGDYNSGKTWFLNNLENTNYQSSYQNATPAFSFVESSISPYVYMDTQGLKRLASSSIRDDSSRHSIKDIKALDSLVSDSYNVPSIIFEVRDTGNNDDYCTQEQRHEEYFQDQVIPKKVVVVHNFKNLETISEVEKYIRDDIINPEIGGQLVISSTPGTIGCQYWYVGRIYHFVVAKGGSKAGKFYNKCTFDLIRSTILTNQAYVPKINILNSLIINIEQSLRNNLRDPNLPKDGFVNVKKDSWKLFSFVRNIYNQFSSKPDPDEPIDIETNPFKLIIENNKIKLTNSSFDLEFAFKDSCGFKNIDFNPQCDVTFNELENNFGITCDLPNSYINWSCSKNNPNIVFLYYERKSPTYSTSHIKNKINRRTYIKHRKYFVIPTKHWITCKSLISTAVYKDGTAHVSLSEDSTVVAGSPFPKDDNN